MSDIADKLDEARALLEEHGWAQGAYAFDQYAHIVEDEETQPPTCFCALGAISMAVRGYVDADTKAAELRPYEGALAEATGNPDIAHWNDAPERTQAEVVDAFKRAAELARAEKSSLDSTEDR